MIFAFRVVGLIAVFGLGLLTGCDDRATAQDPLVFVAASFDQAVEAVSAPEPLRVQAASSSVLARQIVQGARPSSPKELFRSLRNSYEFRRNLSGNS